MTALILYSKSEIEARHHVVARLFALCRFEKQFVRPLTNEANTADAIGDASLWGIFPKRGEG